MLSENKITRVERKSGGSTKREKRERERENRLCFGQALMMKRERKPETREEGGKREEGFVLFFPKN